MEFTNLASLGVFNSLEAARALMKLAHESDSNNHKKLLVSSGLKLLDQLLCQVILTKLLPFGSRNAPETVLGGLGILVEISEANNGVKLGEIQPIVLQCRAIQLEIENCLHQVSPSVKQNHIFANNSVLMADQISLRAVNVEKSPAQLSVAALGSQLCDRVEFTLDSMENQIEEY